MKKKYIALLSLIISLIGIISFSYAYWMQSETQKEINVVGSDCFKLTIMDESKGIELTSTHPVTDEEGKQEEGYSFTIQNVCNKIAYYQVNLEEMGLGNIKALPEQYIKLSLNNSDGRNITDYEEVKETIKGSVDAHKLTSGRLKPNEKVSYNLKLWMDYDTPAIEEVMNATYESKVSIIATGIEEEKLENEITITTESEEKEYRNDKETIKITARSTNYNIIEYSYDGEVYQSITPSKEVMLEKEEMEEGTYKVYFKDEVGNIQEGSYETSKLDQTPPEIEITETAEKLSSKLSIKFTDTKSGLKDYKIDGEWISITGQEQTIEYVSKENKGITITVRDQLGNESTEEYEITKVDTEGPVLVVNHELETWGEKDNIQVKATDTNKIKKITITKDGKVVLEKIYEDPKETQEEILEVNENGEYTILAEDIFENQNTTTITIDKVDKDGPNIIEFKETNTWGTTNTLTAIVEDKQSGIAAYAFTETKDLPQEWTKEEPVTTESRTFTYEASENKTYYFHVKDALGHISTKEVTVTKIDKEGPSITKFENTTTNWATSNQLSATVQDNQSGIAAYAFTTSKEAPKDGWTEEQTTTTDRKTYTYQANDNVDYYFHAKDALGNISTNGPVKASKVDTTEPDASFTIQNHEDGTAHSGWYKKLTLRIEATDSQSGVTSAKYCIGTSECDPNKEATLSDGTTSRTFDVDFETNESAQKVCVTVTDGVNRTKKVCDSTAYKVDTIDPTQAISINPKSPDGNNSWYKTNPTITVTTNDTGSGVLSAKYCTTTSSTEKCNPTSETTITNGKYTVELSSNASAQKICSQITDTSGRTSDVDCSETYKVDGETPTANIKSATVNKDNIIIDATTSTDEHSKIASYTFRLSNETTTTNETGIYTFTGLFNGNYTVTVEVTDTAGNTSSVTSNTLEITAYHKVTYVDFEEGYTSSYPEYILDGNTFEMTLKDPYPVGAKPFIEDEAVPYEYKQDTLVVNNVTGDLVIKSNYIQNIEDLVTLSKRTIAGESYENKTIQLERDLNFQDSESYRNSERTNFGNINGQLMTELSSGSGFIPIGTMDHRFKGIFEGNKHTISNLKIVNKTTSASVGFFGAIENATVQNLNLQGEINTEVNANVGGLAGYSYSTLTIENIESRVNVTGLGESGNNGGIFGSTDTTVNLTLKNVKNYGNITYGIQVGGFIGLLQGDVTFDNCHNYGTITYDGKSDSQLKRAGGFVGCTETKISDMDLTIKNSSNEGTIKATSSEDTMTKEQDSGGLIGAIRRSSNNHVTIENSYNSGEVTGKGYLGGLIGAYFNDNGTLNITESYNKGKIISSLNTSGGIMGSANISSGTLTITDSHNEGSITGGSVTGGIIGNSGTPGSTITINGSYNEGTINSKNASSGGIIGYATGIVNIESTYNQGEVTGGYTGGIIGNGGGSNITITDSHNKGNITGEKDTGGIIGNSGVLATITINGSHNEGTISSETYTCGGIIGYSNGTANIESTYNGGSMLTGGTAGGIIGFSENAKIITITNSHNESSISSSGGQSGGIIGRINGTVNIESTYNQGEITGKSYVGGFIGFGLGSTVTITDSHNKGNVTGENDTGGIIGNSGGSATITIKSLYNEGTINSKNASSGGIIGYSNGTANIESSHNKGSILTGNKAGGIIGYAEKCYAIIDKSYNTGNLSCNHNNNRNACGGILGRIENVANSYILNSYNEGMITGENSENFDPTDAGIVGRTEADKMSIINSYNIGNINGNAPNGIVFRYDNSKTININNVYNAGELSSNGYGIGYLNTTSGYTVTNTYYDNRVTNASNVSGIGASKSLNDIKSSAFVQILNDNIKNIKLDDNLSEYQLVSWKMGDNGFPTLAY